MSMLTHGLSVTGDWAVIEAQLPPNWRALARAYGVSREVPPHLGAKLQGDPGLVLRLVLHHVATDTSLEQTTAQAAVAGLVDVSAVALHLRMRTIGPYLAALTSQLEQADATFAPERWAGYDVLAGDATVVTRPGARGTTARVHYLLRLSTLRPVQTVVTDEHGGEMLRRFTVARAQLALLDRAYCNPPDIAHAHAAAAAVIVRYNRGTLPLYDAHGRRLDVAAKVRRLGRPSRARSWTASVRTAAGDVIVGRVCALRLPTAKADEARARVRKERGAALTTADLEWAPYVVVFTTVPATRLSATEVLRLYRLRWQQELHIKRDKSLGGLDRLPNARPDTIESWICAKLLALALTRKLTAASAAFPPGALDGEVSAHAA